MLRNHQPCRGTHGLTFSYNFVAKYSDNIQEESYQKRTCKHEMYLGESPVLQ